VDLIGISQFHRTTAGVGTRIALLALCQIIILPTQRIDRRDHLIAAAEELR
jgi:hypothetical protein